MQALVYVDLAKKRAVEFIGGSNFKFPSLTYGEDVTMALRFMERVNGESSEASLNVRELRASIGRIDARPEGGKIRIKVGNAAPVEGTNVTDEIAHNASAKQVADALNELTVVGTTYGEASAESKGDSWLITFEDETAAVPLSVTSNSLFPLSFFRVRASEFNGQFVHDVRLIQAPIASTDQSARVVPPPPSITTLEDGGATDDGGEWPEVQKLFVPPTFRGVYQIRRGFKKTGMLDRTDSEVDVAKAINDALRDDDDEAFRVELPADNTMHIHFEGSLMGINHDELEIEVFDAPEGDLTFTLSLDTPELHALLRKSEKVTLPIEIEAEIEDPNDSERTYTRKLVKDMVTIERELHFEELSTVASVDWQRPPLPKSYVPFVTDQVSNGQLHFATADFGNGTTGPYVLDHNLNTPRVDVLVFPNSSTGEPLKRGTLAEVATGDADFAFDRKTNNSLEITFAATKAPAYNAYLATVFGLELTSFFDPHTHTPEQIVGLMAILDNFGQRLATLEARAGLGTLKGVDAGGGALAAHWQLPPLFEVFPSRAVIEDPMTRLIDLDDSQLGRARGLLAAVHDSAVESLPNPLPAASANYVGRVFQNNTGGEMFLTGGKGIRSTRIQSGEYAACDGRLWYAVTRYGEHAAPVEFTTDYQTDDTKLSAPDNEFPVGTLVTLSTTNALPAPLVAGDYEVFSRDKDHVELAVVGGDEAITLTGDGTGTHSMTKKVETSYYPKAFERELFRLPVNERQLRLKSRFELRFALELAVLKSNTAAMWAIALEVGEKIATTTPAKTGRNIESIVWRGTPLLEQAIVVSPISTVHRLGIQIDRTMKDGIDTLTATNLVYGTTEGAVAPKSANFILRARLIRFDTEDGQSDPLGFVAMKGFKIEVPSSQAAAHEGTAFIT